MAQAVELISKGMHPFHDHSRVPFAAGCTSVAIFWCEILQPGLSDHGRIEKAAVLKWSGLFSISYVLFVFSKSCLAKRKTSVLFKPLDGFNIEVLQSLSLRCGQLVGIFDLLSSLLPPNCSLCLFRKKRKQEQCEHIELKKPALQKKNCLETVLKVSKLLVH